jgi:hypothetical protein
MMDDATERFTIEVDGRLAPIEMCFSAEGFAEERHEGLPQCRRVDAGEVRRQPTVADYPIDESVDKPLNGRETANLRQQRRRSVSHG